MIRTKFLITIFFCVIFFSAFSQKVTDVAFNIQNKIVVITYKIEGVKFNQTLNTKIYVSIDGGNTFEDIIKTVSGDIGDKVHSGMNKVYWDVFKDMDGLVGNIVFDVKVEVVSEKIKKRIFLTYSGSLDAPIGFTVGILGKTGYYFSTKFNSFSAENPYTYSDDGLWFDESENWAYFFKDTEEIKRLSLTVGVTQQLGRNVFFYAGGGYGLKKLFWEIDLYSYYYDDIVSNEYVLNPEYSYSGFESEIGLIIRMKKILITAGYTNVAFKYSNLTFGLGFNF